MLVRLFALFCAFSFTHTKLQGLLLSHCGIPPLFGRLSVQMDTVSLNLLLNGWKEAYITGRCNSVFGNEVLKFRMIALRVHFDY